MSMLENEEKNEYIKKLEIIKESANAAYDGLFIADSKGKTIYFNDAYLSLANKDPIVLENTTVEERIDMGLYKVSPTNECIKTGKTFTAIYHKDTRKLVTTSVPVFDENKDLVAVVTNIRDIENLKYLEKNSSEDFTYIMDQIEEDGPLEERYEAEIKYHRQRFKKNSETMIGQSESFNKLLELMYRVADSESTVLIAGATGTGKEVIANQIHINSARADEAYIKVNCAAIPANLLESELFGYEEGAFTGAKKKKIGKFELADKGTLLLDEIGEMDICLQTKLLRVIQEREISRLGGNDSIPVDVRIITSTNKDLYKMVKEGTFREDLYYRLNVLPIKLPPLRERREDIFLLANHFIKTNNKKEKKHKVLTSDALRILENYNWPGNVRELSNLIERIV
ncbi:MAG: sigma-54 interaction domain-containing protein, partial [bacterium]